MITHRAAVFVGFLALVCGGSAPAEECLEKIGQSPYGWSEDVAVNGVTAVMGNGRAMQVIDLIDPSNPVVVGEITVPELVEAVEVTDTHAFVGTRSVLTIVDVSDPEFPTPLGTLGDLWIRDLVFAGDHLYVLGFDELVVVDVSTPATPVELGRLEWPDDQSVDLSVQGTTGFIIVDGSLRVLDLSDPTAPAEITELGFGVDRDAKHLDIAGDHGYVIVSGPDPFDYSFAVVDVSDSSHPVKVTEIAASFGGRDIHIHGDLALVNGSGLEIYDISDPANPFARGSQPIECFYNLNTVVATGDAALVTCEVTGLNIIDIADPDDPSPMAEVSAPGSIDDAAAADGALFIAADDQGLRVVDVSDPAQPAELGSAEEPFFARGVAAEGDVAYVVELGGLTVLDVSDPGAPVALGNAAGANGHWVTIADGYAYVLDRFEGALSVVDVASPGSPVLVGSLVLGSGPLEEWRWPVVIGDHVVVRDSYQGNRLVVVDVSDPTTPVQVATVPLEADGYDFGVAAMGSWLLAADYLDVDSSESGARAITPVVRVFDMRDPTAPVEVAPYHPVGGGMGVITVAGSVAYLSVIDIGAQQSGAIEAVNFANPTNPVFLELKPRQWPVTRMTAATDEIFVFDRQTGFDIFTLCHDPLFADGFESGDTDEWSGVTP